MDKEQLDPVARHIVDSYLATAAYGRLFREEHNFAPSQMARVHHMRSVIQARLTADDRYDLSAEYIEYGKVQFTDLDADEELILRSMGTVAVEQQYSDSQYALFRIRAVSTTKMPRFLIYQFAKQGLILSTAASCRHVRGKRLYVSGEISSIGMWPYKPIDGGDGNEPFYQDQRDSFEELGDFGFDTDTGTSGDLR